MLDLCDRVRANTANHVNDEIDAKIQENIRFYASQPPEIIDQRIHELDHEWDIERILITQASSLAFTGLLLGLTRNQKWFAVPAVVLPFLLLHGIKGWCPPVPIWRRLGVRTRSEIDCEKFAIKAMRGDFENIAPSKEQTRPRAAEVLEAVGRS